MDVFLEKLELHGFKSFPDKTTIKFHKGINVIIGPNGCGKSNIVDAILWVLGEQRIKNLRGENNEDLIFAGSESKKPLGMTEVGAYFKINEEQLYIARRFFRSGESKYIMNDKYCRNRDIQDKLFEINLGGKGYYIFEQGSIGKLIELKPSEKRMLIEEAAGISQYLERKKDTANKLIIAEQNLETVENLLGDKENRLRELKNQVNYARRYRNHQNELVGFLKTLYWLEFNTYNKNFKEIKQKIEELIDKETVLSKELNKNQKIMLDKEAIRWNLEKELKESQRNLYEIKSGIIENNSNKEKSIQRDKFLDQRIYELENRIKENNNLIKENELKIKNFEANKLELESKTDEKRKKIEEHKKALNNLKQELNKLNQEKNEKSKSGFEIEFKLTKLKNALIDMDKKYEITQNDIKSRTNFIKELEKQIQEKKIEELKKDLKSLESEIEEKSKHIEDMEKDLEEKRNNLNNINNEINTIKNEINGLENQRQKYEDMLGKISEENELGDRDNFEGYFKDFIISEEKYFKAIENFYYDEIESIILKDTKNINNLNSNKIFIKKVQKDINIPLQNEKGFVKFLKDTFKTSNDLKRYLKDGIITKDLDSAINIFLKYDVDCVTINGEVLKSSGLIIKNREKGILNIVDEIRKIKKLIESNKNKLNELTKTYEQKEMYFNQSEENFKTEQDNFNTKKQEYLSLKTKMESEIKDIERNKKRIEINKKEIEIFSNQLKELESKRKEIEKELTEVKERNKNYKSEINETSDKIEEIKSKINSLEKEFITQENEYKLVNEKIKSFNLSKSESESSIKRLNDQIKSFLNNIENLKNEKDEISIQIKDIDKSNKELENQRDKFDKEVKSKEEEFNKIKIEIKELNENINKLRENLDNVKDEKNELEIKLSTLKRDLSNLESNTFKELNIDLNTLEPDEELKEKDLSYLREQVEILTNRLSSMRASNKLNFSAESEYEILDKDFKFHLSQREDIISSIENMKQAIERIDEESKKAFLKAFEEIRKNFKKNFKLLFEGGEADIEIINDSNVLESGLNIKAYPTGKTIKSSLFLSGGEKTLTSLAFLFSLFEYRPSPFCVFDEVDASLDDANIGRFLKFVQKLKDQTQFIIITHNFNTMEGADYIYGVTMDEPGISKIYSVEMKKLQEESLKKLKKDLNKDKK